MELADKIDFFRALAPQGLPQRTAQFLAEASVVRCMVRGETLYRQSSRITHLYCVYSGKVRLTRNLPSGAEALYGVRTSGDLIGDIAILASASHLNSAACVEDGQLLLLPTAEFRQLVAEEPALSFFLVQKFASRLYDMLYLAGHQHHIDVPCRLARQLLLLAGKFGAPVADGTAINLHLPQEDLAMMIGATRQSVGAHLVKWQRLGWIRQHYGRIEILRMSALHTVADSIETG